MKFRKLLTEGEFNPAYGKVMAKFTEDCFKETGKYPFEIAKGELHTTQAWKTMQEKCKEIQDSSK
jgi:hypothetical protein